MADKEISGLTAAAALAAADLLHISQGGNSRKATGTQLQVLGTAAISLLPVAGRWYGFTGITSAVASTGALNGTAQFSLFLVLRPITLSDLGIRVATLFSGGFMQVAIYAADPTTGLPTGSQLAATGNLSTTSAALVTGDISGADVLLAPGFYWAACNSDNATSRHQGLNNATGQAFTAIHLGSTTATDINSATTTIGFFLTTPLTFGTWGDLTAATFTRVSSTQGGVNMIGKAA